MDKIFPLGFSVSAPASWYELLSILTLVLHVLFMNYVLAGTGFLAYIGIKRYILKSRTSSSDENSPENKLSAILRDWMPFMVSGAITAGVAPLLFVQLLYQQQFYTSNLLLSHRWMIILPILIIAFYLLYLLKSKTITGWNPLWRILVGIITFLAFLFVAWSWTENHLLMLRHDQWPEIYISKSLFYHDEAIIPRLLTWITGSMPTMSCILLWQILITPDNSTKNVNPITTPPQSKTLHPQHNNSLIIITRTLPIFAMTGLLLSAVCAFWYAISSTEISVWNIVTSQQPAPAYLIAASLGLIIQTIGWLAILLTRNHKKTFGLIISIGLITTLTSVTIIRELIRLNITGSENVIARANQASQASGLYTFLLFTAFGIITIAWCIIAAQNTTKKP